MSQSELVIKVINALNSIGCEYMVTGSIASSFYGEPRATHDIDLVISMKKKMTDKLVELFPAPDFYLDKDSILQAIDGKSMFNLIDISSGQKVDFWILTEEPFDESRFSRAIFQDFYGDKIRVSSPEDTILAKLKWAKMMGGSEKQYTDALRIYEIRSKNLDLGYLKLWANKLDVEKLLAKILDNAETG